jgi:hypothetical protein
MAVLIAVLPSYTTEPTENFHIQLQYSLKGFDDIYNIRDYGVFGLCPLPGTLKDTMFRKLNLFPSLGEGVTEVSSH